MNKHFIKNIEIKNFKCFENFKADGFGRVNLIGGKNNVGKTAFMEACCIISYLSQFMLSHSSFKKNYGASSIERDLIYFEMIKSLIVLENNRKTDDFLIEWIKDEFELNNFTSFEITLNDKFKITLDDDMLIPEYKYHNWANYGAVALSRYRENKYFYQIFKKNNFPQIHNTTFISPYNSNHYNLINMIDIIKIEGKDEALNLLFNEIFNIEKIDVIKNKVMVKQDKSFKDLNDFGDGIKYFLNIILVLFTNKEKVIYIDEVENGIHYTLLDKLWEIILTVSKEQNVQVFATTHSKECIESYAMVAKKLEETKKIDKDDIKFISIYKNKQDAIQALTFNQIEINERLELGLDNR